ncbi:hypothetical protein BU14_0769s0007, partial [Porphyra umbilicalis]
ADVTTTRRALLPLLALPLLAAVGGAPAPARADRTAAATRVAIDRYLPRIREAAATLRSIRDAVEAGDTAAAVASIESKPFDIKVRNALIIYSGTFSDNYVSERTAAMKSDVKRMYDALATAVKALNAYGRRGRLPQDVTEALTL